MLCLVESKACPVTLAVCDAVALSLRSWAALRPDSKAALAYGGRRWTRMPAIAIYVNLLAITGTLSRLVGVLKSLTAPYTRSKGKGSL